MAFKCLEKCEEACQRRIGIALLTIFGILTVVGLVELFINLV